MKIGDKISDGVVFAGWDLARDAHGIKCVACGKGYAEEVESTLDECSDYGCGRDRPGMECCAAAFVCAVCGERNVGQRVPPEMG
jgi:hypothetical protein